MTSSPGQAKVKSGVMNVSRVRLCACVCVCVTPGWMSSHLWCFHHAVAPPHAGANEIKKINNKWDVRRIGDLHSFLFSSAKVGERKKKKTFWAESDIADAQSHAVAQRVGRECGGYRQHAATCTQ